MNPILPAHIQGGLVLASASPRRAQILEMLGFEFEIVPTRVEDEHAGAGAPAEHVCELARLKAQAAAAGRRRGTTIGADTIVAVDGEILGKPDSGAHGLDMLRRLRGRWHTVHTGIALRDIPSGRLVDGVESTEVHFHDWADEFLRRYVQTGECADKAGSYAIQGLGAMLVREIRGCYYNVMGFPVGRFVTLLRRLHPSEDERAG
ncbi:MAG: nucleoside triphosphate pyrophosphatase [Candidatus Krumholzibacteriia bacterium]